MKSSKKNRIVSLILICSLVTSGLVMLPVLAANDWNPGTLYNNLVDSSSGKTVGDYTDRNPNISGEKVQLEEMELAEKAWFEYVAYQTSPAKSDEGEDGYTYRIYAPTNYAESSIMAIRDYNPNQISGSQTELGTMWDDMALVFANIAAANLSVIGSGGAVAGIQGAIQQEIIAVGVGALFHNTEDILKNVPYYNSPEFMGISDSEWSGISNTGFYNADDITIQMDASESFNVAKTNTVSSDYSVGGESTVSVSTSGFVKLVAEMSGEIKNSASSALGYGVDYQQGQSVDNSISVSRTFERRTDEEVANVGWKLCEYVVRVPYKVEVVATEKDGTETVLSCSYVTQDLLSGVCRVFANGYIEHWNTGKLVSYADFFEGFITETELIAKAKAEMKGGQS